MQVFNLSAIGEEALLPATDLNVLYTSLYWEKEDNLDLMIFYKTLDGKVGYVNSSKLPKGNEGNFKEFPFIKYMGGGLLKDKEKTPLLYDKSEISGLDKYQEIYFVVTNFAEFSLKRKINFNSYRGFLKLKPEYPNKYCDKRFVVKLSAEESGDFLFLAKIRMENENYFVKNINSVMTFDYFKENIPGAYNFKR